MRSPNTYHARLNVPEILVTGATGFVGSHVVSHLCAQGYSVRALVRTGEQARHLADTGCQAWIGDLMGPMSLPGIGQDITQVLHLAANASLVDSDDAFKVNTVGTRNLLQAVADTPTLRRFTLMSSMTAVSRSTGSRLRRPVDATSDEEPDTAYGRSKREAERLVEEAFESREVQTVVLRPALVYGQGNRSTGGMNTLVRLATTGLGRLNLTGRLSTIHVDDLASVCAIALEGRLDGRSPVFVTDGSPTTFGELFRTVSALAGHPRPQTPVGLFCAGIQLIYAALDATLGISRWLPAFRLAPFGASLACEANPKDLGYTPRYSLKSGLTQTLRNT